jgi:uncharacterized protein (DUF4415 family)
MATNKINPTLIDAENPEWTTTDFKDARPASQVLREIFPEQVAEKMLAPKPGRVLGSGTKSSTTLRFDNDILAAFKATGRGWQTRINNALRDWLKEHKPA